MLARLGVRARRARRHGGRQPRGVHRVLLRRHADGRNPAAAQHPARGRYARDYIFEDAAACSPLVEPELQPRRDRDRGSASRCAIACCSIRPSAAGWPSRRRWQASAAGRAAADRGRCAGVPALHVRLDRPAQGRDHDPPRHALVRRLQPALLAGSPDDRGMVALPLFHKNALRGTVKPMLYAGGSFVLMPAYEPRAYLEALAKYQLHLFARRRGRLHDVPAAPRRARQARPAARCAACPSARRW